MYKNIINTIISYTTPWELPPKEFRNKPLKFYGRVNTWASESEKKLRTDLILCKSNGIDGYHIELSGWDSNSTGGIWNNQKLFDRTINRYEWLVKQCRALGLWLFVSIVNDNMGSGKYGDKSPTLDKVFSKALSLMDVIKKCGSNNILVQPVAEAHTDAGFKFERKCKKDLNGFNLVYNGDWGRPGSAKGMKYRAWHPSSISSISKIKNASNCIVSSDHGNIIRELSYGLDGKMKPDKIAKFYNNVKSINAPVCCFYAFLLKDTDKSGIEEFGKLK